MCAKWATPLKKTYRAQEQSLERVKQLAKQFWEQLEQVPIHKLVFLDECGCQHNMSRSHGRSLRGQRVYDVRPGNTRTTLTVLGVLTIHGLVDTMTVDSGTDKEVFESFVEHVLCKHLEQGDVVVMDNLAAHKSAKAKTLIEAVGARIVFQPPYSPQVNPIEMAWAKLKALLRAARVRSREQIEAVIKESLIKLDYSDAQGWFKACGHS
jgi:transposase